MFRTHPTPGYRLSVFGKRSELALEFNHLCGAENLHSALMECVEDTHEAGTEDPSYAVSGCGHTGKPTISLKGHLYTSPPPERL